MRRTRSIRPPPPLNSSPSPPPSSPTPRIPRPCSPPGVSPPRSLPPWTTATSSKASPAPVAEHRNQAPLLLHPWHGCLPNRGDRSKGGGAECRLKASWTQSLAVRSWQINGSNAVGRGSDTVGTCGVAGVSLARWGRFSGSRRALAARLPPGPRRAVPAPFNSPVGAAGVLHDRGRGRTCARP